MAFLEDSKSIPEWKNRRSPGFRFTPFEVYSTVVYAWTPSIRCRRHARLESEVSVASVPRQKAGRRTARSNVTDTLHGYA